MSSHLLSQAPANTDNDLLPQAVAKINIQLNGERIAANRGSVFTAKDEISGGSATIEMEVSVISDNFEVKSVTLNTGKPSTRQDGETPAHGKETEPAHACGKTFRLICELVLAPGRESTEGQPAGALTNHESGFDVLPINRASGSSFTSGPIEEEVVGDFTKTSERSKGSEPKLKIALCNVPCEIRQAVYRYFFPVGQNVQITDGPPEWNALKPRREAFPMARDGRAMLLACRQFNTEITQLLYGTNTFLVTPGERNAGSHKVRPLPHQDWKIFLTSLNLSTKQSVKTLHLCLGSSLRWAFINKLPVQLAGFRKVIVTVEPTHLLKPNIRLIQRQYLRKSCRLVAAARSGLPRDATVWDDCGDAATERLLRDIMPSGYCSVA